MIKSHDELDLAKFQLGKACKWLKEHSDAAEHAVDTNQGCSACLACQVKKKKKGQNRFLCIREGMAFIYFI